MNNYDIVIVALVGNLICVPVMKTIFTEFFSEYVVEETEKTLMVTSL